MFRYPNSRQTADRGQYSINGRHRELTCLLCDLWDHNPLNWGIWYQGPGFSIESISNLSLQRSLNYQLQATQMSCGHSIFNQHNILQSGVREFDDRFLALVCTINSVQLNLVMIMVMKFLLPHGLSQEAGSSTTYTHKTKPKKIEIKRSLCIDFSNVSFKNEE